MPRVAVVLITFISLLAPFVLDCSSPNNFNQLTPQTKPQVENNPPAQNFTPPTPQTRQLVEANNAFALDLSARLRDDTSGNLFFSPYSISTALAMIYSGARGETATQMQKTLHFSESPSQLPASFAALIKATNEGPEKASRGFQLSVANALWGQRGFTFQPAYLNLTKTQFAAHLEEVDFATQTEQARQTINAWVEGQTQGKITELFKPGMIESDSRLVLTNAIYFKGEWLHPFDKSATVDGPFNVSNAKQVTTRLMHQKGRFGYLEDATAQAVSLPYGPLIKPGSGEGALSMLVILPKQATRLMEVERSLNPSRLNEIRTKLTPLEVDLTLPKFTVTSKFTLNDVLTQMGMPLAFSKRADFSGMTGKPDLYLAIVAHQAFVEVNEEGTEAAAATGGGMMPTSMPPPPKVFRADHPFIFVIYDNRTGSMLFMGRVQNPVA